MRVFFIGTVKFSFHALQLLIAKNVEIVGVCTKADSAFNADYADLSPVCHTRSIPFKQVRDINHPNNVQFIKDCRPDVIYCFGWSSLLKEDILSMTPLGVIGFHPAALPNNKGRHPLIWALVLGLEKTASTFFFMDEGADTGDILSSEEIVILPEDTADTLYSRMTQTALTQIASFTKSLAAGNYSRIKQPTGTGNSWRKRGKNDGKIDFRMSSRTIYNLVRALTKPYVGAHIETANGDVKVWAVKEIAEERLNLEPGKVLAVSEEGILVKTADNAILITQHSFDETMTPKIGEYL